MGNSNLTNGGSNSLLDKGMDIFKDPNSSKGAKAAAVGVITIGAIAYIGKKVLDIIAEDKA